MPDAGGGSFLTAKYLAGVAAAAVVGIATAVLLLLFEGTLHVLQDLIWDDLTDALGAR